MQLLNLWFNPPNIRKTQPLRATPTVLQLLQFPAMQSSTSLGTDADIIEVWDPTPLNSSSPAHLINIPNAPAVPNVQDVDTQDTILDTQGDLCAQKEETERATP